MARGEQYLKSINTTINRVSRGRVPTTGARRNMMLATYVAESGCNAQEFLPVLHRDMAAFKVAAGLAIPEIGFARRMAGLREKNAKILRMHRRQNRDYARKLKLAGLLGWMYRKKLL